LADACGADEAFFLINGTSSGIIAMILTAVKAGEKIILPRNVTNRSSTVSFFPAPSRFT
jgi:lysine decarboxylase